MTTLLTALPAAVMTAPTYGELYDRAMDAEGTLHGLGMFLTVILIVWLFFQFRNENNGRNPE